MALGMSNADIAVSKKGIADYQAKIKSDADKAKKSCTVNSSNFKTLKSTIQKYWTGVDCDNFIADLEAAATELEGACDGVYTKLINALQAYYDEFVSMQGKNYAQGTTKING